MDNRDSDTDMADQPVADPLIFIQPMFRRYINHFKMHGNTYRVKVKQFDGDPAEALQYFGDRLDEVTETVLRNIPGDDHISLQISWDGLDGKVFLNWSKRSEFDIRRVLDVISSLIQSNKSVTLDEPMEIEVNSVECQSGCGRMACLARRTTLSVSDWVYLKQGMISITKNGTACLGRALAVGIARHCWKAGTISESAFKNVSANNRPRQLNDAKHLYRKAGVSCQEPCGFRELSMFQRIITDYQIIVKTRANHNGHDTFFEGPEKDKKIHLLLANNHYDVIISLTAFYDTDYVCGACKKPYSRKDQHSCFNPCGACKLFGCTTVKWNACKDCNRFFMSETCYANHKKSTVCKNYRRCTECEVSYKVRLKDGHDMHRCGHAWCSTCKKVRPTAHYCFIPPDNNTEVMAEDLPEGTVVPVVRFLFYDFESRQDMLLQQDKNGDRFKHIVNYACVQEECVPAVMGSVSCGGPHKCDKCCEHVFKGDNALQEFCDYLIRQDGAIAIAHNAGGYDAQFIIDFLLQEGIKTPKVIYRGRKIISAHIPCGDHGVRLIDSLNFVMAPLATFPKMFGLTLLKKGYFPHLFNTKTNWEYDGPMPSATTYGVETMKDSDRCTFEVWYEAHKNDQFVLQRELSEYCQSDVQILREGMLKFRLLWMKHGGVDPLRECVTIASASMLVFRRHYLEADTIGIIPKGGYTHKQNQSRSALTWLKWLALTTARHIQHSGNGSEHKVGRYYVDGYHESSNTVYEFQGCHWHGCPKCFKADSVNHVTKELRLNELCRTRKKIAHLKSCGYTVIEMWECLFNSMCKEDLSLKEFLISNKIIEPLDPRLAFFGGRTNGIVLHYDCKADEEIKVLDVTSLYPWVNARCKYPIGHPRVITEHFAPLSEYFGLVLCTVHPPRKLFVPVLPLKSNGKLTFPLCKTCADEMAQADCTHSEEDRSWTGTYTTVELTKAVEMGYCIVHIYEVWHYENTRVGLFSEYIKKFLKVKQEASGWPQGCETEEEKAEYVHAYYLNEGIQLDPSTIAPSPIRPVAKLALNSLWGKFGQRADLTKTVYVDNYDDLMTYLDDDMLVISDIQIVSDTHARVIYQDSTESRIPAYTNVIVASFTTSHARLKLYSAMETIAANDKTSLLYTDTDSLFFVKRSGQVSPTCGRYLGDWTDEHPGKRIVKFVTAGPKVYSYSFEDGSHVTKAKGISINSSNSSTICPATLEKMVLRSDGSSVTITNPKKISRDVTDCVITRTEKKKFRVVYTKRVIKDDFVTYPYGY